MSAAVKCLRLICHHNVSSQVVKRLLYRIQVARAIIHDRDHRSPLVLGSILPKRRSREQATRRARANALKSRFDFVMAGASVEHARVDIGASATRKALEEIAHQFHLQISDSRRADPCIDDRRRASTEIDGRQAESLVHGHDEISGAQNAATISKRAVEDFAQSNPNIFDGVVLIHFQVADRLEFQIESAVPCKQLQHVVQKVDSRRNLVLTTALDGERNLESQFPRSCDAAWLSSRAHLTMLPEFPE